MSEKPPVRKMIKDAVEEIGGRATHKQIKNWINEKFNGVNQNTIGAQLNACTVNMPGRVGMPENDHPRENDPRYDFLYSIGRGEVVFYEPKIHGRWTIMQDENGKTTIARDGIPDTNSSSNLEESPLLKFVRDEMQMQANYQPIVIKMLLESKGGSSTFTFKQAAITILKQYEQPMNYKRIIEIMFEQNLIETKGKTPQRTLMTEINREISKNGENSIFKKIDEGVYGLRDYTAESNETGESSFAVSYDDIKKKFDELNFDSERFTEGGRNSGSFGSSMDSVKGALEEFVTYDNGATKGGMALKQEQFNHSEIREILKICGQKIAKWHIDNFVDDEFGIWRMPPGRIKENSPYEREFLESNTIAIGWGLIGDEIAEKNMTKEQTEELFHKKYPPTPENANSPRAFTNFTHEMKPKDIIVLIKKNTIVDFAIVVGAYRHQKDPSINIPDNAKSYSHRRDVVWLNRGTIPESEAFEFSRMGACDRVKDAQRKEEYINVLLEEERESRDYWAVKTGTEELATWQMLLSSKKILHKGLDIDLSEFYDEDGNYKHELVKGDRVSQELKDEIKRKDSKAEKHQTVSWQATDFKKFMSIKKNDIVLVWSGDKKVGFKIHGHGKVTSEYMFVGKDPNYFHQKSVEWINTDEKKLPAELERIKGGGTPSTKFMNFHELPHEWKKSLFRTETGRSTTAPTDKEEDHCEELKDKGYFELLERKKQMIFYGPPGTGKTWTANKVAKCFTKTELDGTPPDKFLDRIIDELRERAEDSGYTFEKAGNRRNQNLYVLKKDELEIRVDFHEANTDYFQVNAGTTFLTENPEAKNYLILTKDKVESFVCLPYEIEQKYSKFVSEGDGTGGWDPTGKGKHSVHNLKINETEAHFEPKNESCQTEYVSKFLNTWNDLDHDFAASNRGRNIYNVTFHPSYSYEDFVEGFRPNEKENSSQYILDDGIFKRAAKHAKRHDNSKIILNIDEINRGNIPKIFGELISIVEHDKRGPTNTLKLAYSKKDFFVPENLFIIGTMNTADKSLVQMDEALRRRFGFEELMPNADLLDKRYEELSVPKSDAADYKHILEKLNDKIVEGEDRKRQNRDKQIGHSYFWDIKNDHRLRFAIKYQIIPLLQDYFYDDYEQIKTVLGSKIIGKDNRPTGLLDKGRETDLKVALLNFLYNKEQPEPEEEQEENEE